MKFSKSIFGKAAAVAVVLAAAGGAAHAGSNVYFSVAGAVAPGVVVSASNAPYYYQPAPVYYQPAPVYYRPAPVVYGAPMYYQPAPVVYYGKKRHHHHRYPSQVAYVRY